MRHSSTALVILIFVFICCFANAHPASIWDVDILTSPAPPPDQGPPLSAGALRDESKLKYEIAGIVGAYFFWVFVTLLLLLLVGKRLRHKIQTSNQTLSMEIVKPSPLSSHPGMSMEPPLKSPGKMASLKSWASGGKSHSHKPSNISMATTIDEKIVEADRVKNMDEMAKLYAAVMAHDEEKSQKTMNSSQTSPKTPSFPLTPRSPYPPSQMTLPPTPRSPYYQPHLSGPASPRSPRYPPEFQHLRNPSSEAKNHGIEPAALTLIHPLAPTPAEDPSTRTSSQSSTRKFKASPLSLASTRADSANQNKRRPSQISVRGQPISQPIASANLTQSLTDQENALESPRIYNPGPPPPTPGQSTGILIQETERRRPSVPLSVTSTAGESNHSLPFRQFYADTLRSAPPTKTTFLEKRESILGVHPKTGVPQTPYSPYTPFTPMTPITPRHLVTKEDRRRNRKKEGMKVLSEDDMVMSDEDMWGELK
jgi:hypothetical protein